MISVAQHNLQVSGEFLSNYFPVWFANTDRVMVRHNVHACMQFMQCCTARSMPGPGPVGLRCGRDCVSVGGQLPRCC